MSNRKKITLDVETTIFQKGNPFSKRNKLVVAGFLEEGKFNLIRTNFPDSCNLSNSLLIGFNIKFDLHWLRRYNVAFDVNTRIWDCQLAEFLLSNQIEKFPSLDSVASRRGLGHKFDSIRINYWENSIDTDAIPVEELDAYLKQDLLLTAKLQELQEEELKNRGLLKLFELQCYDLLVLEEMEWNGIKYDVELSRKKEEDCVVEIEKIDTELSKFLPNEVKINFSSRDHLSCFLYGGTIKNIVRLPIGEYKSGKKIGETRYKLEDFPITLKGFISPPKGSNLKKDGYYSTNEETLRSLKGNKQITRIASLLLRRAEINKIRGTYYKGLVDLISTMEWEPGYLHGQFNQCIAITGRLSSSRPNQQNFAGEAKQCLITRY